MNVSEISRPVEVVASLEGMKIIARADSCELYLYNFAENAWHQIEDSPRPLTAEKAKRWLNGWNRVDFHAAHRCLVEPLGK